MLIKRVQIQATSMMNMMSKMMTALLNAEVMTTAADAGDDANCW